MLFFDWEFNIDDMTYEEFRNHLGKAGLTTYQFAEITRMNRNSVSNCSQRGSVPTHLAVIVSLLGEMNENKLDFRRILSKIEIAPKQPRGGSSKGRFGGSKQIELRIGDTYD